MQLSLESGKMVGPYRLDRLLGVGGMGQVWAGRHGETDRAVALKFVRKDVLTPETRRRLMKEARASRAIQHPAVVPVEDVLESDDGGPALVMELLSGKPLSAFPKPTEARELAGLLRPVAEGLAAAHRAGVIHRDVKPENIFVTDSGEVKIIDFGIAKELTIDEQTARSLGTQTGTIVGTPQYMSPEQAFAEKDIDHRTDIWSLGLVLYEYASGVLPTQADSFGQVLKILLSTAIPKLRAEMPDAPRDLAILVDRMLRREREERPRDMDEVAGILAAVAGSEPDAEQGLILRVDDADSNDAWLATEANGASVPRPRTRGDVDRTGEQISHYAIRSKLGQGGMGIVYAAEDVRLRRKVALKLLPAAFMASHDRRQRFLREARSASAVQHANVATVFDIGESDDTVYIAMEYVEGSTLRAALDAEGGPFDTPRAVAVGLQLARGLARAHDSGIVHRDVKPENVIITPDEVVKILDFGLAKPVRSSEPPAEGDEAAAGDDFTSRVGQVAGTPAYMAPEQAEGRPVDARTDVYALGLILYEMVMGARPKRRDGSLDPRATSALSGRLARVIARCLEPDPDDRYPHARALADDLAILQPAAGRRTSTAVWALGALAFAGAAAFGIYAFTHATASPGDAAATAEPARTSRPAADTAKTATGANARESAAVTPATAERTAASPSASAAPTAPATGAPRPAKIAKQPDPLSHQK